MDSLSQIVLGASVAHVTLGEKLGKRALILGAVVGTLPDLDVLVPYTDAIESFTYHRSWSHSLFMLTLFSFPLAWLCKRLTPTIDMAYSRWWLGLWLVLITHALLDGFTIYGTQIWWPLSTPPTAWGSVFIIDPLFTLPLIAGVVIAWRTQWLKARSVVATALLVSTLYLGWTLFSLHLTRGKVIDTLAINEIEANHIMIAPFPFSLLWRVIVVTDGEYLEGYSSLLDSSPTISMDGYNNGKIACNEWQTHWPIQRMDWFTRGAFALSVMDNMLILSDLRMGIEDDYVFEFVVAEWENDAWQMIVTRKLPLTIDADRMKLLFYRMVDESVDLTPLAPSRQMAAESCKGEQYASYITNH